MYLEPNNPSLSFANFLDAAIRDKAEIKPFPYTLEVCRCRYCSYCQNGKCALKRCCCMSERVKAKSCTFAELLRDCFANFKDNVFQFRLRIACERASELKTCFLDEGHRGRFYEGVSYMRKKDPKFIAQLYLLSASELLWIRAKQVMCSPGFIDYSCLDLKLTEPNAYLYRPLPRMGKDREADPRPCRSAIRRKNDCRYKQAHPHRRTWTFRRKLRKSN